MINNFIKSSHKYVDASIFLLKNKVKKKKSFIKICVNVVKSINGGNYLIKIYRNYEYYGLKNGETYCVTNKVWDDYYKFINLNLKINELEVIQMMKFL